MHARPAAEDGASIQERHGSKRRRRKWPQLGDRPTVPSDRQACAGLDAIDDIAAVVAELPNRDLVHGRVYHA